MKFLSKYKNFFHQISFLNAICKVSDILSDNYTPNSIEWDTDSILIQKNGQVKVGQEPCSFFHNNGFV